MKQALILEDMPESQEMLREVAQLAFPNIHVRCVAEVAAAMKLIQQVQFDLALIDLSLPDGDGTTVIQAMTSRYPNCMIVVASLFNDDGHLFPALRAGAQGYLLKDQPPEQLVSQLCGINEGHPPLSPSVARRLLDHFREIPGSHEPQPPLLTSRERQVLIKLSSGNSIEKIGFELGISRHTVGDHVKNLYRKLKISSRAEAALQARFLGLLNKDV
jgi:DNA-binding NarL/FixJ family response regulator